MSAIDQIKELEKQKEALVSQAKAELTKQLDDIIASLAELGFYYELTERSAPKRKRRKRKPTE